MVLVRHTGNVATAVKSNRHHSALQWLENRTQQPTTFFPAMQASRNLNCSTAFSFFYLFFLISLKLWLKTPQSSSSRNVTPEDDSWHSEASLAHTTNVQTFSKTFLSYFSFFSPFCTFPQTVVLRPYLAKQPRRSKDVCPLPIAVPYWRTKLSASRKQVINTNH